MFHIWMYVSSCKSVDMRIHIIKYEEDSSIVVKIITVKLTKPWTPEIFMECYRVARNKPIRLIFWTSFLALWRNVLK